jgi:alanyl-tRNA synthetase
VVAAAQGADANAGDVVDDVTGEFGGGGGGGPPFAQGGGIDADPEAVADYVREG